MFSFLVALRPARTSRVTISTRLARVDSCLISSTSTTVAATLAVEFAITTPLRCSYRRLGCLKLRQLGLERKNFFGVRRISFQNRSVVVWIRDFAVEIRFGVFHGVRRIFQSEHSIVVKKIGDLVCGFAPRLLVLPVSRKALDHSLSNAALKEVPENRHLFEIFADSQAHSCDFRVDVVEGLSFATRGNIVQEAGQVVDEFAVDHIREALEFEKQVRPYLNCGNLPQVGFPLVFIPSILTRYKLANLCGVHDVLQPLVCLCVRLACWINSVVQNFQNSAIDFNNVALVDIIMPSFEMVFSDLQLIGFSPGRSDHVLFVLDQGQI